MSDVSGQLTASLRRLEATIEAETESLVALRPFDQDEVNRRKGQSLLELTRLSRRLDDAPPEPEALACLGRLRAKLERNHEVVAMHLRAAQEVSDIVARALRDADSDGTYAPPARR
ncbi:flagellar protein FlgN [Methylobacterium oryzihabitans]|uniref:Flagellar protein FlgN n=1 Tax=Methylobacterium oryzihabitans TaxID=2499852 RepID=A0A3S2WE87_9HYPH|nr:flagellar protein FlgN [Methylobacterium oryzihabitans]